MRHHKTYVEKWSEKLKRNKPVAVAILCTALIVAIGQISGSFTSVLDLVRKLGAPRNLNEFRFKEQIVQFEGGNGTSLEKAIIINGAKTSDAGIAAEQHWIKQFYPDYKITFQAEVASRSNKSRQYDRLTIESRQTAFQLDLYFDVTSFYGSPMSNLSSQRMSEQIMLALKEAERNVKGKGPHEYLISVEGTSVTARLVAPNHLIDRPAAR